MKVLICGGTGFLGEAITRKLLREGNAVRVLGRSLDKIRALFGDSVEGVQGDITKSETLPKALEKMEAVVQCAQFPGHPFENRKKGSTYWQVDGLGTENVARLVKKAGVRHLLYISGAGVDGKKTEPWFKAKWYAEQAVHASGVGTTILRPSWIYGPKDKSLNRILAQARTLPFLPMIGNGKNRVQPLFVEDLAAIFPYLVGEASFLPGRDRIFEIGGPEEMTMKTMLQRALNAAGLKRVILPIPNFLMRPILGKAVDFITMDVSINMEPFKKAYPQFKPKSLEATLKSYL